MTTPPEFKDLADRLSVAIEPFAGGGRTLVWSGLRKAVADATVKFVVHGPDGNPELFLLCSSPNGPDVVARGARRARAIANALGPELGKAVLLPEGEGELDGCSFAAYRLCTPLIGQGPKWWVQRAWVRPRVLEWLTKASLATARVIPDDQLDERVYAPLERMVSEHDYSSRLRGVAARTIEATRRGDWSPLHTFMHDDLWVGNVLVDHHSLGGHRFGKLVIIDWAGGRVRGYPMYDFLRITSSFKISGKAFTTALQTYRDTLGLSRRQGLYAYATAVAELGGRLSEWPRKRYLATVERCYRKLIGLD